jgi:hypothetical protein
MKRFCAVLPNAFGAFPVKPDRLSYMKNFNNFSGLGLKMSKPVCYIVQEYNFLQQ